MGLKKVARESSKKFLLEIGGWLLVNGYWLLVIGYWLWSEASSRRSRWSVRSWLARAAGATANLNKLIESVDFY